MRHRRPIVATAALLCALLPGAAAFADEDAASIAQPCIKHSQLKRTKVLGTRNILFVTRDGSLYNNELPRQCPSMRRNAIVNYSIRGPNADMCAGDSFQVLWDVGSSYMPAFVCQLGLFAPISEDEAADLEAITAERSERRPRRRGERDMVQTESVELPAEPPATASPPATP